MISHSLVPQFHSYETYAITGGGGEDFGCESHGFQGKWRGE